MRAFAPAPPGPKDTHNPAFSPRELRDVYERAKLHSKQEVHA